MDPRTLAVKLTQVLINPLMALFFAVGLLVFIWGLVQFIWGLNAETESKEQGKKHMLYGIIGMFIMVAAYAIVQLIGNTIGAPVPSRIR